MSKEQTDKTLQDLEEESDLQFARIANDIVKVYKPIEYRGRKLAQKDIRPLLSNPVSNASKLQNISNYLFVTSGAYMRIIRYFVTMSTNDILLTPYDIPMKPDKEEMMKSYVKAAKFLEKFNYKYEFLKARTKLLINGEYYVYKVESDNTVTFMELPRDYCRLSGYKDEVGLVEFNMNYFSGLNDEKFDNFPEEFKVKYEQYINNDSSKNKKKKRNTTSDFNWIQLSSDAIAFSLYDNQQKGYPPLTGMFEDVMEIDDYKDLTKNKTELENYYLLHLKSPFKKDARTWKDTLIPLDKLKIFHNNAKKNTPSQVGTAADFLEWELFKFDKNTSELDSVANAERSIFTSAGVSSLLFNNEKASALALAQSIISDSTWMFQLSRIFELFLKRELKKIGNSTYNWKAKILDVTYFNKKEQLQTVKEIATFGGNKMEIWATQGYSPMEAINTLIWENDVLDITNRMIPLQSSHTQSDSQPVGRKDDIETDNGEKSLENR